MMGQDSKPKSGEDVTVLEYEHGLDVDGLEREDADFLAGFSKEKRRKVIRKVDVSP